MTKLAPTTIFSSPPLSVWLAALLLLAGITSLQGANWAHWRGPHFNGATDETNLPAHFSKSENLKWVTELPGPSAATPIIWGDHVFISSVNEKAGTLQAMALDRKTGKTLWNQEVSAGVGRDNRSNFASPSPVTDGKLVWFFYGNGDLVAFDFSGKKIWSRSLTKDYGEFAFQWTFSTSPTLYGDKLIMQVLQRDVPVQGRGKTDGPIESFLLALEAKSGKVLWRHVRPSEARAESLEAFTTPIPFSHDGRNELLVAGGDCLTGHDPATGKELWRWGTWNPTRITHWRLVPSPVAGGGTILACAPKASPIYGIKAGANRTLADSDYLWKSDDREISSDVCTPAFYQGRFFVLNGDRKVLARIDPTNGKPDWIGELGTRAKLESSPTVADGKLYFMDFRGTVFVAEAGDSFKLLHQTEMGDEGDDLLRSSIAISQGNLFIRTGHKLYCVGQ